MVNDNRTELSQWVEERTRPLAPPADWKPDVNAARARFKTRAQERPGPTRYLIAGATAISLAGMVLVVSPTARAFAEYCWRCVATGSIEVAGGNVDGPSTEAASETTLPPDQSRKVAPDFTLRDANGKEVRLSDYRGKVVLLNFWATWCPPCRVEIPWFAELEQTHKDQGFAALGVSLGENWQVVKPFLAKLEVNYRIVIGDDETAAQFGVTALPTTFLIDREGGIAAVHEGLTSQRDFQEAVETLLGEQ
jgi:cytochrome c biogenesis protein CcmG/thiol:disulfide interchange protein DsbE